MIFRRTICLAAATGWLLAASSATHAASPIEVGQAAPKFALKNQAGKETTLDELLQNGPVALVFYRSADW